MTKTREAYEPKPDGVFVDGELVTLPSAPKVEREKKPEPVAPAEFGELLED